MKKTIVISLFVALLLVACGDKKGGVQGSGWIFAPPEGVVLDTVSIDTMDVRNPFIRYEYRENLYYMVADGGCMWVSSDLREWVGPYKVLCQDPTSWIGISPVVTSPEIHKINGRYYYMATFESPGVEALDADGKPFARRSCVALVADSVCGPYTTIDNRSDLLVTTEMAAHPTHGVDHLGVSYMIYTHQGEQNGNGTVQIVRFSKDFGKRVGEAYIMFSASENGWSGTENGVGRAFSPIMDAPFLFMTDGGEMGILFTTYVGDEKAIGVAYTATGIYGYNGPWTIEPQPLLEGVGNAMLFDDYDGTKVMVVNKDTIVNGETRSVARFYKLDMQFEKIKIEGHYKF